MSNAPLPVIKTARLVLVHAQPGNELRTVDFFERNRSHFSRWDPPAPSDFYTERFWQRGLWRALEDFYADRNVRFDMLRAGEEDGPLIGRIGFSQIFRGPFQSCMLGYQIDAAHEGQGLMFEALGAAIDYMFDARHLHRVQANHLEENERSARLLARLEFVREGLARDYLFIAGRWRDHIMMARLNSAFPDAAIGEAVRL